MSEPIISIRSIYKRFPGGVTAVDDANLDIMPGEFFALLGPSGCGKTTLLRMIAGFEVPSEGEIHLEGSNILRVPPNKRPINMVFQSYAVFPHMTVADNVAYGLRVTGDTPGSEVATRVQEALDMVKLGDYGQRKPDQLSGGQRQRVALARALVKKPKVLLLDEPLSALDAKLREAMQLELVRLQQQVGITFIIVTHDQHEALSMADRIAVMEYGKIRQIAGPAELYEHPNCRFVADFIGKMNLFEASVVGVDGGSLALDAECLGRVVMPSQGQAAGKVGIAVRPEKITLSKEQPDEGLMKFQGKVAEVAYYGDTSFIFVHDKDGRPCSVNLKNEKRATAPSVEVGDAVWCSWAPSDAILLDD